MKRILTVCLLAVLLMALALPVSAAVAAESYLVDQANLLTYGQQVEVENALRRACAKYDYKVTVAILTVESTGWDAQDFADRFYEGKGRSVYGWAEDGIVLCIGIEDRTLTYSTIGDGIDIFDDEAMDELDDAIDYALSNGDFRTAFLRYADTAGNVLVDYFRFPLLRNLIIALVAGVVIALLVTFTMKSKLTSVRQQKAADLYMVRDSLRLTSQSDRFLYVTVSKVARPRENSSGSGTHRSSSGTSHGGRSRSF